jgi:hypothetical protein
MSVRVNKASFSIREKLSELERPIGLKGSELMRAETVQEARDLVSAGRRNLIINGGFDVWQRGTSTTGDLSNAFGSADRWRFHTRSCTTRNISRQAFTAGQSDVPGNPVYFLRGEFSNNSGSIGVYIMQRIEDVRVGSGEDVTVSFYAKLNSGGGTFNAAFSQQFGSGGSSAVDIVAGSFVPTSSWQKYSFTISLPSISGKTVGGASYLRLDIRFPANTAATLDISQIQLELGRNATEFEHRSYGEELALCQRYYNRVGSGNLFHGRMNGGSIADYSYFYPVTMRIAPQGNSGFNTASAEYGAIGLTVTNVAVNDTGTHSATIRGYFSNSGTSGYGAYLKLTGTTYVEFNAEL